MNAKYVDKLNEVLKMSNTYFIDLDKLRPTHYYLSQDKLGDVQKHFANHSLEDYPPLPVMPVGGNMLLLGGHHYAYYLHKKGKHIAEVYTACDYNFIAV